MPKYLKNKQIFLIVLILIILTGSYSGTYYFYRKYNQIKKGAQIPVLTETAALIQEVGEIMDLPTDEIPTIATITDKEKIKGQAFFKKAENGDKLLAYAKNQQAILYRPGTHKIIKIAPIYSENTTETVFK